MRPPDCVDCGLPVLELVGQCATLAPYLSVHGSPPVQTAGAWHLTCLAGASVAQDWGAALVRSYLEVRRFSLVGTTDQWSVVRNPNTGEVLALGRAGVTLPLIGRAFSRVGDVLRVSEAEYWLEWDEPAILGIQDQLRRTGTVSVREVAHRLGTGHRLSHPDLLADSVFRLDPALVPDWRPGMVGAPVDYAVYLPSELIPFVA